MHQMTRSLAALPLLALLIPQIVLAHGPTAPPTRPMFVYPAAHQTIPYSGSWSFAVRPITGARGYLWSFVQDGVIRWQNLTFEHRLSGRSYTIASGSTAHRHLHPGWLWVWVQALLPHERWSGVTTLTVVLRSPPAPTATLTPQPTNTPIPQPTSPPAAPTPGQTLYTADWSSGRNGWSLPQGWDTVSGELVNDGTSDADLTKIAHPPTIIPYTANYAAEADIQMVRPTSAAFCNFSTSGFGLAMRGDSTGAYVVGMATESQGSSWMGTIADTGGEVGDPCDLVTKHALATNNFNLDTSWHTYRVEVRGNDIKLLIDGNPVVETTDNHHLRSNAVGMWCAGTVINVRSFKVIAL